eukprot:9680771-Alexandrium_andersonii.AAC.1
MPRIIGRGGVWALVPGTPTDTFVWRNSRICAVTTSGGIPRLASPRAINEYRMVSKAFLISAWKTINGVWHSPAR